jgi:hypothetical protein
MEKVYTGKIIQRGPGSVSVPLSADMVKRFGVKLGDPVDYYYDGDALVLKFPKAGNAPEEEGDGF